jgi:hypothetical protein
LLANVHLSPVDQALRRQQLTALAAAFAASGLPGIIFGDFNAVLADPEMLAFQAGGDFLPADSLEESWLPTRSTRRRSGAVVPGRHIDYAMVSRMAGPTSRAQRPTTSDHDLVAYTFDFAALPPVYRLSPARRLIGDHPDDIPPAPLDDAFSQLWRPVEEGRFAALLAEHRVDEAWTTLSDAAELVLAAGPPTPTKRSAPPVLVLAPRAPTRHGTRSSVLARRLRHLFFRTHAVLYGDEAALRRWRTSLRSLRAQVPALSRFEVPSHDLLECLRQELREIAVRERNRRLSQWRERGQASHPRTRAWVLAAMPEAPADDVCWAPAAPPPHTEATRLWQQLWSRPCDFEAEDLAAFTGLLRSPAPPGVVLDALDPRLLRRCVRKAVHTCAGLDQWRASHWQHLPLAWFACLARLWATIIAAGRLPLLWCSAHVSLMPKVPSGWRPISVALVAWRTVASAVQRLLRDWLAGVVHPSLWGGIPRRDPVLAIVAASGAFRAARVHRRPISGLVLDLAKCFDHFWPAAVLQLLRWYGLPEPFLAVLEFFHSHRLAYFRVLGSYDPRSCRPSSGILQGCPLSVLITALIMSLWARLLAYFFQASALVFIDDRLLWLDTPDAPLVLPVVLDFTVDFDAVFGGCLNLGKCRAFSSSPDLRRQLRRTLPQLTVLPTVEFLHTPLPLRAADAALGMRYARPKSLALALWRLRRIAVAFELPSQAALAVLQLVLPLFRWTSQGAAFPATTLQQLRNAIASAVLRGATRGLPRAAMWLAALEARLDPWYDVLANMLRTELRCLRAAPSRAGPGAIAGVTQFARVLQSVGWHPLGAVSFETQYGPVHFDTLSRSSALSWLRCAWTQHLLLSDPAASAPGVRAYICRMQPVLQPLQRAFGVPSHRATAMGYSPAIALHQVRARACPCGSPTLSRVHFGYRCPLVSAPLPLVLDFQPLVALKLCVPFVRPFWRGVLPDDLDTHPALLRVAAALAHTDASMHVLVATDGAASRRRHLAVAAVVLALPAGLATAAWPVPGHDQSPYAAEVEALARVLPLLARSPATFTVCVDSEPAFAFVCHALRRASPPIFMRRAFLVLSGLHAPRVALLRTPAHQRLPSWDPRSAFTAPECRRLNRLADEAAGALLGDMTRDYVGLAFDALHAAFLWANSAIFRMSVARNWLCHDPGQCPPLSEPPIEA